MRVPPHPHTGLQTVTWLLRGEVLHQDSIGSEQVVRPGALNLMTAGRGIAHAETSTDDSPALRGVQLWVALPDADRDAAPAFEHHAALPGVEDGGLSATVLVGSLAGAQSPATTYTPDRRRRRVDRRGHVGGAPAGDRVGARGARPVAGTRRRR